MKKVSYETPVVEVVIFKAEDIIVTSNTSSGGVTGEGDNWGGSWGDDF